MSESIKSRILRLEILRDLVDLKLDGSTCRVKRQGTLSESPTCFAALAEGAERMVVLP